MDDGAALFRRRRRWHPSLHAARTDHSRRPRSRRRHPRDGHALSPQLEAPRHRRGDGALSSRGRIQRLLPEPPDAPGRSPRVRRGDHAQGPRRVAGAHRPYPLRRRYRLHPVPPAGDPQRPPGFVPRQRGDHRARRPDLAHQRIRLAGPRKRRRSPGRRRRPAAGQPPGAFGQAAEPAGTRPGALLPAGPALSRSGPGPDPGGQCHRLYAQPDFLPAQPGARPELLPVRQPDPPATPARPAFRRASSDGSTNWPSPPASIRCRPSTAASASTPASLRANT